MNWTVPERIALKRKWLAENRARKREEAQKERLLVRDTVVAEVCRRMRLGMGLRAVLDEDRLMPSFETLMKWRREDPAVEALIQQAQRDRADALFEQVLDVADDARNDWMERHDPDNPGWVANGEHIQRSKIRVDARKWAAAKLNPHKYGDKLNVEGDPEKPVVVSVTHRFVTVTPEDETLAPVIEHQRSDWDDAED